MSALDVALVVALFFVAAIALLGYLALKRPGTKVKASTKVGIFLGQIEVSAEPVQEAVNRIVAGSVAIAKALIPLPSMPTFEKWPLYRDVHVPEMKFLAIRVELEARLRILGYAAEAPPGLELDPLVDAMTNQGFWDKDASSALKELIVMGDQVAQGARVDPRTVESLDGGKVGVGTVLYALATLATVTRAKRVSVAPKEGMETHPSGQADWLQTVLVDAKWQGSKLMLCVIKTAGGQAVTVPMARSGAAPLVFWAAPDPSAPSEAFTDDSGNVLATLVYVAGGWMASLVTQYLEPLYSFQAIVNPDLTEMRFGDDVAYAPRPEEFLPQVSTPGHAPEPLQQLLSQAPRSEYGNLRFLMRQAADGGWTKMVVAKDGQPLSTMLNLGQVLGEDRVTAIDEGHQSATLTAIGIMEGLDGLAVVVLDEHGRPVHSPGYLESLSSPEEK